MGRLIDGIWHDQWYDTQSTDGRFEREEATFRGWVSADGSTPYPAEAGRYHLYVSLACPWAHRTLAFRVLKGLEAAVSVSVVEPLMLDDGWTLGPGADPVNGARRLHEVYTKARPGMTGRVTVPVLWDKRTAAIVSNESADIIRMFNHGFGTLASGADYYPAALRPEIDAVNAVVYDRVNNGVYKAGFATTQAAYEDAFDTLFATLDSLEDRLSGRRYLCGDRPTEADWRLWTTLVRFDAVYHGHFKCNRRRLVDYPNLWGFTRDLYQTPGIAATVDLAAIKRHYYGSHAALNPTAIVAKGPDIDFTTPHGRHRLGRPSA
jgi:putative glutathione S-transferase